MDLIAQTVAANRSDPISQVCKEFTGTMEQLKKMLGDNAETVAEFRGEPLSKQLSQDILEELEICGFVCNVKCQYFRLEVIFHHACLMGPECSASVVAYANGEDYLGVRKESPFEPRTVAGLNKLIDWAQEVIANLKRRGGFCQPCLEEEPPRKRLRVHQQAECAQCFLAKHLE